MVIIKPIKTSKVSCIYKLKFPDGSFYIGSTINLSQRISSYKQSFKNSIGSVNKLIANKVSIYNTCEFEIIMVVDSNNDCKKYEDIFIKEYSNDIKCLNRSTSAFSNNGMTKQKLKEKLSI